MWGLKWVEFRDVIQPKAGQFKAESDHRNEYEIRTSWKTWLSLHNKTHLMFTSNPEVKALEALGDQSLSLLGLNCWLSYCEWWRSLPPEVLRQPLSLASPPLFPQVTLGTSSPGPLHMHCTGLLKVFPFPGIWRDWVKPGQMGFCSKASLS